MSWLLWREYRLNRVILATGALLLLLPYAVGLIAMCFYAVMQTPFQEEIEGVVALSVAASWFTVLLLGSNAIAGECADRSAEFIAYLPLPRERLLASKLMLCLITVTTMLGFNVLIVLGYSTESPLLIVAWISILALTYGASWMMSSLQSSVVVAAVAGFVATVLVVFFVSYFCVAPFAETSEPVDFEKEVTLPMLRWMIGSNLVGGVVCFCIGTWHYLRTAELR